MTGRIPDHRVLAVEAAEQAGASLGWPAPKDPDRAIDDLEHDLAVLKPLLDTRDPASVKGHAHYLLGLNDALRRSVISRWARGRAAWSTSDGLIKAAPAIKSALDGQRLGRRPYSLSALQRFASCPYQFLLATIYRLEPWDEPEPLVRMDPLTRGSLFHSVQAEFYRAMQAENALPVSADRLPHAVKTLDAALERVADDYAEQLAPAGARVLDVVDDDAHVGPSDYVPWLTDRKWCYIRIEGTTFGNLPLNCELKLEVWDSPNSAGVVIDAVRCAKLALDRGIGGALLGPASYFMKSPI